MVGLGCFGARPDGLEQEEEEMKEALAALFLRKTSQVPTHLSTAGPPLSPDSLLRPFRNDRES